MAKKNQNKIFSTAFNRLAVTGCYAPKGTDKDAILKAVDELVTQLTNSESPLAIKELAVLFSIDLASFKKILAKNIKLFKSYYRITTVEDKAAVMRIDCKFRQDPLVFLALIIGVLRFSGYTEDFISIRSKPRDTKIAKIRWPKNLIDEHKILQKICMGPMDEYPETVAFLAINYVWGDPVLSGNRTSRLLPGLLILLGELHIRNRRTDNNEVSDEKSLLEGSKKDVL